MFYIHVCIRLWQASLVKLPPRRIDPGRGIEVALLAVELLGVAIRDIYCI